MEMPSKFYWLLDSRAWTAEDHELPDFVIVGDESPEAICEDANSGSYGENLAITDDDFNILHDWKDENGIWRPI